MKENINIITINNFIDFNTSTIYKYSSNGTFSESGASIQIFNSPDCDGERIQVPIEGSGRYWYVCDINGGDGTINVINQVQNSEPSF